MKQIKNKVMYILSIVLFSVSFGYFIAFCLLELFVDIGGIFPFGFFNDGFGAVLDVLFRQEISILPMLICFGLSVVLSVVLTAGFREHLRSRQDILFTACAPLVLLAYYAVLMVVGRLTEGLGGWRIHNIIMSSVSFVLLAAYMVGFYTVMHREQKRLWAETDAESP